jgi:hypothetical protein
MATRRAQLTTEHVTALNLIEIDFQGKTRVLQAWKVFFENLCTDPKDQPKFQRSVAERQSLLTRLLHEIAKIVGYPIEQLDILAGGYTPQAVYNTFQRQQDLQTAAIEVLSGTKPLLVKAIHEEA